MYKNIFIILLIFIIITYLIVSFKNTEHMTFKEIEKKRLEDDKKKPKFSIIVNTNKINDLNKHIIGFGSQTSLNIYKVNYNNDKKEKY